MNTNMKPEANKWTLVFIAFQLKSPQILFVFHLSSGITSHAQVYQPSHKQML